MQTIEALSLFGYAAMVADGDEDFVFGSINEIAANALGEPYLSWPEEDHDGGHRTERVMALLLASEILESPAKD